MIDVVEFTILPPLAVSKASYGLPLVVGIAPDKSSYLKGLKPGYNKVISTSYPRFHLSFFNIPLVQGKFKLAVQWASKSFMNISFS